MAYPLHLSPPFYKEVLLGIVYADSVAPRLFCDKTGVVRRCEDGMEVVTLGIDHNKAYTGVDIKHMFFPDKLFLFKPRLEPPGYLHGLFLGGVL